MGFLSERAWTRVNGGSWVHLREAFTRINDALTGVSEHAFGDLTTIYIKYSITASATSPVYAVVWVKSGKELVVGMALPEGVSAPGLVGPPQGTKYKGLTRYFVVRPGDTVPDLIDDWARLAFQTVVDDPASLP